MTWGRTQRSLRTELAYAVAKAAAVTGLLLAAHVGNAVVTDVAASEEGRTTIGTDGPASTTGYRPVPSDGVTD